MSSYKPIELGISCPGCGYVISTDDISLVHFPSQFGQRPAFECPNCNTAHAYDERDIRSYSPQPPRTAAA